MALFPKDQLVALEVELESFAAAIDSRGVRTFLLGQVARDSTSIDLFLHLSLLTGLAALSTKVIFVGLCLCNTLLGR